jgi:hypothetical protein
VGMYDRDTLDRIRLLEGDEFVVVGEIIVR